MVPSFPYPNGTCWSSILWPSYRCSIMWWQSHFYTAVLLSGRWAPGLVYNRNLCTTYSYAPDNSTALPSTLGALDRGEDDTRLSASFTIVEEKKTEGTDIVLLENSPQDYIPYLSRLISHAAILTLPLRRAEAETRPRIPKIQENSLADTVLYSETFYFP